MAEQKTPRRSKRMKTVLGKVDRSKFYPVDDALKLVKETAVAKKLHHGWILDEYFIVWELEGKKQKVLYHVKYPMDLLPNGDAAPPNTYVAAAAAAGLC